MLHIITNLQDTLLELIKDDPVRPEISAQDRVNDYSKIYILINELDSKPRAVVCVKFQNSIPQSVDELATGLTDFTHAIFYTIWSYSSGAGQQLIRESKQWIEDNIPTVNTFVTLSPPTEMARKFHLKNGALIYRENTTTVNYQYA
jgi:hypothetical protein